MLGRYNENEDLVIFENLHDPGPAKKFKKCENSQNNFLDRNNQESFNLRAERHFR